MDLFDNITWEESWMRTTICISGISLFLGGETEAIGVLNRAMWADLHLNGSFCLLPWKYTFDNFCPPPLFLSLRFLPDEPFLKVHFLDKIFQNQFCKRRPSLSPYPTSQFLREEGKYCTKGAFTTEFLPSQ